MSEKREHTLQLVQDQSGRTASVHVTQGGKDDTPTILELKGDTVKTHLKQVPPGVRVDWGDGTTTTTDESVSSSKYVVRHTYTDSVQTPRIVKIYGMKERKRVYLETPFDDTNLIGVRQLGEMYDLAGLFSFCKELKSIPASLFNQNRGAKSLEACFNGCSSLKTIPASLFTGMSQVVNLTSCFQGCSGLQSLPEGLFNDFRAETFSNCFQACTSLQSLPRDLFASQTVVKDFSGCFIGCAGLTAVPEGLFDSSSMATDFSGCFSGCTSLTGIPRGLFDHQHNATDFEFCFKHCDVLKGETPYATVDGRRVKLWERDPDANGYAKVKTSAQCFAFSSQLSDYDAIPGGWK